MKDTLKHRFAAGAAAVVTLIALPTAFTVASEGPSLAATSHSADGTVTWTGNGTINGACASAENLDVSVPAGEQAWLFILTSPGSSPYELTTNLGDATGTQEGNGSVHFLLFTSLNAVLTSASAVTGTTNSVLTVSGCQFGASSESPTTSTTTTTTAPTTTATTIGGTSGGTTTGGGVSTSPSTLSPGTSGGPTAASSPASATSTAPRPGIAFTGANVTAQLAAALLLIGTGSALLLGLRRRRARESA